MKNITIIDYGAGNVKSVKFALERLGAKVKLSSNPEEIKNADKVIFPGVGRAKFAMERLRESGLTELIPNLKQPLLGICLGMQLLCEHSEEDNVDGIGIFPLKVKRFKNDLKVPKIGWNNISDLKGDLFDAINENEYCYFVHSYYVEDSKYSSASSNYGLKYSAALQKDNFYATQFHPEKSGKTGELMLKNFIEL